MDWIKNRWLVAVIVFVFIAAAVTITVLLLSEPRQGTYTNAWYVMYGKRIIL